MNAFGCWIGSSSRLLTSLVLASPRGSAEGMHNAGEQGTFQSLRYKKRLWFAKRFSDIRVLHEQPPHHQKKSLQTMTIHPMGKCAKLLNDFPLWGTIPNNPLPVSIFPLTLYLKLFRFVPRRVGRGTAVCMRPVLTRYVGVGMDVPIGALRGAVSNVMHVGWIPGVRCSHQPANLLHSWAKHATQRLGSSCHTPQSTALLDKPWPGGNDPSYNRSVDKSFHLGQP